MDPDPHLPPSDPPAVQAAPPTPVGATQYEFSPEQDALIGDLGEKMGFVGGFMLLAALLSLTTSLVVLVRSRDLYVDLGSVVLLFVATWTIRSGRDFRRVAETRGKDISHLMGALEGLRAAYSLIYLLLAVTLAVFAIVLIYAAITGGPGLRFSLGGRAGA